MTERGLIDAQRFAAAIDRVARRRIATAREPSLEVEGVSLATLWRDARHAARHMVEDLRNGGLAPQPGRVFHLERDGKSRRLFSFPLIEMIIHDAVASWLVERAEPGWSPRLYSYRRNYSSHEAVRLLAGYVRKHRRQASAQHPAGLYVLRRDVRAYFDSIPVHDGAPLWGKLRVLLERDDGAEWKLLLRAVRPLLHDSEGRPQRLDFGVPTGSPVANVVANLYLAELDAACDATQAFYLRYGDDIAAAHPDALVMDELRRQMTAAVCVAGLELNAAKNRDLHLTPSGRDGDARFGGKGTDSVEFLGYRVDAHGTVSLSRQKTRDLLAELRRCAQRAAAADATTSGVEQRARCAIQAINRRLDPDHALAHPYARLLRSGVTDRAHLRALDHELALTVLQAATGRRTVKAFRLLPPAVLRNRLGLRSLVAQRNRV